MGCLDHVHKIWSDILEMGRWSVWMICWHITPPDLIGDSGHLSPFSPFGRNFCLPPRNPFPAKNCTLLHTMGDCTVWAVKDSDLILCIELHNCLADLNSDVVRVNHFLYSVKCLFANKTFHLCWADLKSTLLVLSRHLPSLAIHRVNCLADLQWCVLTTVVVLLSFSFLY